MTNDRLITGVDFGVAAGTPIRAAEQGGDTTERITFWCPHCQS